MEQLLNCKTCRGVKRYLVRWRGHDSAADSWVRVEDLVHCPERVAEYDAAAPRRRAARRGAATVRRQEPVSSPAAAAAPPGVIAAPPGFRFAVGAEVLSGAGLVGRQVLYWWPSDGWQRGRVMRTCGRGFSHVVAYAARSSALGTCVVASLLDGASHGPGGRWLLLLAL